MAGQANQPNEQAEKINLLEMPREILEDILVQLDDDKDLLKASHVCKLFASVAETAFARKYSDRYFEMSYFGWVRKLFGRDDNDEREKSFYKVMLAKYGGRMRRINVSENDEEQLDLIERSCNNLERVKLIDVSKMINLKDLKKISLTRVGNLSRETFADFISRNKQLESVALLDIHLNLIEVLDGQLRSLKTLKYYFDAGFDTNSQKIRLNSLETLKLNSLQRVSFVRLLQTLECKQLKQLQLEFYHSSDDNGEVTNAICKFETLASLRMMHFPVTAIQLEKLAAHLPHLTELSIQIEGTNPILNNISFVLSILPKLSKLTIRFGDGEDSNHVKKSINEFHAHFANANTEIEIRVNHKDFVVMSKDFAYACKEGSLELHWMANLNAKNVREMMARLWYVSDLEFTNHCGKHTLDICAFLPKSRYQHYLTSLDIKSDGPINFKENSSRHHNFFPRLKILKLHLDERNAIDFLEKLDLILCERIEELWLDTNDSGASRDQELQHTHDMTNILVKFRNLKSLYLAPEFATFDTKQVWSVCQNLKVLHLLR